MIWRDRYKKRYTELESFYKERLENLRNELRIEVEKEVEQKFQKRIS